MLLTPIVSTLDQPVQAFRQEVLRAIVSVCLFLAPQAKPKDLGAHAREVLRGSLAQHAGVDMLKVMLEKVWPPTTECPWLEIRLQVQVGSDVVKAKQLAEAVKVRPLYTRFDSQDECVVLLGGRKSDLCEHVG
jgi:hypothetical protein